MNRGCRSLVVMLVAGAPGLAAAEFRCEQAVQLHTSLCTTSQITPIPQTEAAAVCTEYTQKLAEQCRPDWDKFRSCDEFAARFERLLVRTCEAHKIGKKHCQDWGEAYQAGPLARCQRGKTTY